ncbi:hypothetical protein K440DRAFT_618802, partial [Wilcoxina mikolae CBS 423.85]
AATNPCLSFSTNWTALLIFLVPFASDTLSFCVQVVLEAHRCLQNIESISLVLPSPPTYPGGLQCSGHFTCCQSIRSLIVYQTLVFTQSRTPGLCRYLG